MCSISDPPERSKHVPSLNPSDTVKSVSLAHRQQQNPDKKAFRWNARARRALERASGQMKS